MTTTPNCPNRHTVLKRPNRVRSTRHRGRAVLPPNSHAQAGLSTDGARWQPTLPPRRGADRTAFYAAMLLPGLSIAFHATSLARSRTAIRNYKAAAAAAARDDPAIMVAVEATIRQIRAEDGLAMARLRGKAQLPAWSRMAIAEFRHRGVPRRAIAAAFRCSPGTVANVLQGKGSTYALFSGERRLTLYQQQPPGRWSVRHAPQECTILTDDNSGT